MLTTAKGQGASADSFRKAGYWLDKTVDDLLIEAIARTPDKIAIVADRADRDRALRLSYLELGNRVDQAANSLRALGVGPGDFVTVQLPNWWEFVVTSLACGRIGAVVNPVMPILRERELLYHSFDLASMQAYLSECRMTKLFWPERVEIVGELPRTASGKIQKFKLRDIARTFVAGSKMF